MGLNGWIRWFERLAAGDRRPRRQLLAYVIFLSVALAIATLAKLFG